ncbi:MAG: hypothetical protein IJ017_04590 [Oscillospiraceae bacterium]|nr:hypothetical protein [Oscillospiraceae bacterium]
MTRSEALKLRKIIEQAVQSLSDSSALQAVTLHPAWTTDTAYSADYKVQYGGKLYRCKQAHTSQSGWEPENVPELWEQINETHAGTLEEPIPYDGNMALVSGLYYVQNDVIYLCTRDTVNPVYSSLESLVGLYVEGV